LGRRSATFTVRAELGGEAWEITGRELPWTWAVAFNRDEIDDRARRRISLDTG
jgi:hypothetical protein